MKSLYQIYIAELEKVAIANYHEQRENEKIGLPKAQWNHDLNLQNEEWLNRHVKLIKEMSESGDL